jgi:hypothetical protein
VLVSRDPQNVWQHEFVFRMADGQNRAGRATDDFVRNRSHQHSVDGASPGRADHDEVDCGFPGILGNLLGGTVADPHHWHGSKLAAVSLREAGFELLVTRAFEFGL